MRRAKSRRDLEVNRSETETESGGQRWVTATGRKQKPTRLLGCLRPSKHGDVARLEQLGTDNSCWPYYSCRRLCWHGSVFSRLSELRLCWSFIDDEGTRKKCFSDRVLIHSHPVLIAHRSDLESQWVDGLEADQWP